MTMDSLTTGVIRKSDLKEYLPDIGMIPDGQIAEFEEDAGEPLAMDEYVKVVELGAG